ncbi:MAG: D-alanyl-D-alanine carboxypeptidase [Candidatus Wildermuthbacteria bacterium]|nr:D-alanyl-D-alanine carboxypeptidase [Candidatus Wildermuthbacteria bacterium]
MTTNVRIFIGTLLVSMPLLWGVNALSMRFDNFFFWKEMATNRALLTAQAAEQKLEKLVQETRPTIKPGIPPLDVQGRGALLLFVGDNGKQKILFEKEKDKPFPIASVSKLMAALVVLQNQNLDQKVTVTQNALLEDGEAGNLLPGDVFTVRDLLYPMLIESSNDAATALAQLTGRQLFVGMMNAKAKELGLLNTNFVNPTGLDHGIAPESNNVSSAENIGKLAAFLLQQYPEIFDILSQTKFRLKRLDGSFHHELINTNELLENTEWPGRVIGGKTGFTESAKGCLVLVVRSPKEKGYIVSILLGSGDRFGETKKMIDWTYDAFNW